MTMRGLRGPPVLMGPGAAPSRPGVPSSGYRRSTRQRLYSELSRRSPLPLSPQSYIDLALTKYKQERDFKLLVDAALARLPLEGRALEEVLPLPCTGAANLAHALVKQHGVEILP